MEQKSKRPTLKKIDNDDINRNIANHIAEAERQWQAENPHFELSGDIKAAIQKKVVKGWFKQFEKCIDRAKARFGDDLIEDDEKWPKAWMMKDRDICKRLRIEIIRPEANTWAKVMNWLWKKSGHLAESQRLAKEFLPEDWRFEEVSLKTSGKTEKRPYALLTVDTGEMAADTQISKSLCQKYLKAFCDNGFILDTNRLTGRPRDGGRKIYAIGYWAGHMQYTHRIPFLTDTGENRRALGKFDVQGILKK